MTKPVTPAKSDIVERLRGIYRVPINDGLGKVGGNLEPDNDKEFVRQFQSPPIQIEAADEIERLRAELAALKTLPSPETHVQAPDTATVARHMKDFEAFVAQTAPKLHWKVYQDLGSDPSRSNGYYDGWQHGFGEALFGPLPLTELMAEMKASVTAKVRAATEDGR